MTEGEDQRLEMVKERTLGIHEVSGRCELNDIDDLEGKHEYRSVDRVVDGVRAARNSRLRMQASQRFPLTDLPSNTSMTLRGVACGMDTATILCNKKLAFIKLRDWNESDQKALASRKRSPFRQWC